MCWFPRIEMASQAIVSLKTGLVKYIICIFLLSDNVLSLPGRPGELRCYCNLPTCIPNGYLCKTSGTGRCFFFLEHSRVTVQGCTDLFPARPSSSANQRGAGSGRPTPPAECDYHHRDLQQSFPQLVQTVRRRQSEANAGTLRPTVGCCQSHMCNHVEYTDPLESQLRIALSSNKNGSSTATDQKKGTMGTQGWYWQSPRGGDDARSKHHRRVMDQEMWFKAAVIAVPIVGGFIMLVLVFIAFRLLRQDAHLRRKYLLTYDQHSPGEHLMGAQHHHQLFYNPPEPIATPPAPSGSDPTVVACSSPWPTIEQVKKGTVV